MFAEGQPVEHQLAALKARQVHHGTMPVNTSGHCTKPFFCSSAGEGRVLDGYEGDGILVELATPAPPPFG